MKDAELEDDGIPYCIACADIALERWLFVTTHPEWCDKLPPLWEAEIG